MNYVLSETETELAQKLGRARCSAKNKAIIFNDSGYHDNPDRAFPHILGIKAEIAYSAITGIPLDTELYENKGDESDFGGIEIKSSSWLGNDIELKVKVSEYDRKNPYGYVLARVQGESVEFIGAISRRRFDREKYLRRHKFVDNFCVMSHSLKPLLPYFIRGELRFINF